jgi:hypothetical protein
MVTILLLPVRVKVDSAARIVDNRSLSSSSSNRKNKPQVINSPSNPSPKVRASRELHQMKNQVIAGQGNQKPNLLPPDFQKLELFSFLFRVVRKLYILLSPYISLYFFP